MFLSSASTRRPIAMGCLLIALFAMGVNAYRKLTIEDMPAVDVPYVTVVTTWVGASPEDIEKDVAKHIEDAVSGIDGLKHIESSCLDNVCQVSLEFSMGTDVDTAAQDVREKLDAILAKLPSDADRPVIQKVNLNASAVVTVFLSGDAPLDELYDYADNTIGDKFASVPGVARVDVIGGSEREVLVELDRAKLAAAGLTSGDAVQAMKSGILSVPGGRIRDTGTEYTVRFDAEYDSIDGIGDLEIANKDGARVRIRDVGEVRLATEEVRQRAMLDGRQGVILKIVKKAEGNVVTVVDETRERFEQIKGTLPGGMELTWVTDDSNDIQASVDSAVESVVEAIAVCSIVLLLFLANITTTLIVAVTMPVTVIISLFFMQLAGQSLNTVTLIALGLSTGVLVSNSIVVLENVTSKLNELDDPWEAADRGASEVAVSVLASAGTNVIVMLPIALMSSIVGKMLGPFAVTTLIVNAVSIFISFTLTPILCAMWLKPASRRRDTAASRFQRRWDAGFARWSERYGGFVRLLSRNRAVGLGITAALVVVFLATIKFAGGQLGFTFMLNDDRGRVFIRAEFPPTYDLAKTIARLDAMQEKLLGFSDLEHVMATAGKADASSGQANEGVYMGQFELFFKPKTERPWKMADRLEEIRARLADETDCMISASVPSKMGGQSFQINYRLSGDDLTTLESVAQAIRDRAAANPVISEITTTARDTKPEIRVLPKRAVLSDLRLPATSLGAIVRANVDGVEAASYKKGDRTYDIRVKLAEKGGREQVGEFLLPGADGRPIPLESVADVVERRSMLQIFRVDRQRTVKILGTVADGATMTDASAVIEPVADELTPPGYVFAESGTNEMMGEAISDFAEAIVLAAFLTLLTLCAILESWSRPGLVLLTLPMALIGVFWGLAICDEPLTILVLLGLLMLIGVVVNGAILIVDRMGQLVKEGHGRREAMCMAAADQFRPVLMVVLASGLGMLPIAVSNGIGSENRAGMGIASVAGIIVAGALTLAALPVIFNAFVRRDK